MNIKEIKDLINFLIEKDIAEFELERGNGRVRIRRDVHSSFSSSPAAAAQPAPAVQSTDRRAAPPVQRSAAGAPAEPVEAAATPEEEQLHIIKSPIVGTFYESPSPGSPPFVKAGDAVEIGAVVGIIEAMKLMNEIECDAAGEVVKRLVSNNQPVEYGQPLFSIRVRK